MSRILAIDLGKFKSVTCLLDSDTNQTEFWTMSTDRHYLLAVLKNYHPDLVGDRILRPGWMGSRHLHRGRLRGVGLQSQPGSLEVATHQARDGSRRRLEAG
jgi:hypothetical protein